MIDIDRAEMFSPFRVWARGGQAPLRAQANLLPALLPAHGLEPAAALEAATTTGYRFLGEVASASPAGTAS